MWWAVATLSTMGIDVRPVTPVGKILASLIAVCGILLFALPAGIISSGFVEKYMEARKRRTCPHCGKSLE
jgi:voltage-gated potassium channel